MRSAILAFAAGVLFLQQQSALPASTLVAVCAIAGAGGAVLAIRNEGRGLILILACALLGFAWAAWRADIRLADALPTDWEMKDIRVSGVVASLPQRFGRGERFVLDVDSVETAGARVPSRLILSWYRPDSKGETITPRAKLGGDGESEVPVDEWSESAVEAGGDRTVHPGERWRFTVRLKRPHGTANPHGFDYEAWLLERGIGATGTVRPRDEAIRLGLPIQKNPCPYGEDTKRKDVKNLIRSMSADYPNIRNKIMHALVSIDGSDSWRGEPSPLVYESEESRDDRKQ